MALPYLGGKSARANSMLGAWIVKTLPVPAADQTYIEPFSGMLGVLLQRRPAGTEIASDADGRIIAFWHELRDNTEDFARRVGATLWHRGEYERSLEMLKQRGPSEATGYEPDVALAVAVVLAQSMHHSLGARASDWRSAWQPSSASARMHLLPPQLIAAAERVRAVQFETRSAETLLDRVASVRPAVVYCDPPYTSAEVSWRYGGRAVDVPAITEVLQAQQGRVAVSGYGDEWDHLGWVRNEFPKTVITPPRRGYAGANVTRLEVLWTNYQPAVHIKQQAMLV